LLQKSPRHRSRRRSHGRPGIDDAAPATPASASAHKARSRRPCRGSASVSRRRPA
jgi:hypothetical protein